MCGIIGLFGTDNVGYELYRGLRLLQHRGQSSSGILTYDGNIYPKKDAGLVSNLFRGYNGAEAILEDHPGPIGIAQTRYSTSGDDTPEALKRNAQPEYLVNPFIAACHNGNIVNGKEVLATCSRRPRTDCDIQYLLLPMAENLPPYREMDFDSIADAAAKVMDIVKGSYSALFLTAGKSEPYLIALTDPHKIRPLVVGRKGNTWYIASESAVLKRLGVREFQDVDSGTVLSVNPGEDTVTAKKLVKKRKYHCMFEYIYFADPASWIEGRSVHKVRVEIGKDLGRRTAPEDSDIVVPVPESGRRYAIGFSQGSGIPLEEGLKKDKAHRSFIMQTQKEREKKAKDNMEAIDAAVDGKSVVITDDSLVRGTNIKQVIKKLRDAGARKVHVRIGCPPIIAPCYLGIDMRSKSEFIAVDHEHNRYRSEEEIARLIGADSLAYGSITALRKAIVGGRGGCDICTGCINFPDGYPEDFREEAQRLYDKDTCSSCRAYEV